MLKHMLSDGGKVNQGEPWVITLKHPEKFHVVKDLSVATAPDGSVYVYGYINISWGDGEDYMFLAKLDSAGTVVWQKALRESSSDADRGVSVTTAPDGSVYACGLTFPNNYSQCGSVAKFNPSGDLQWYKLYNGSSNVSFNSMSVAPDGSVYIGGMIDFFPLFMKINSNGERQWQKEGGSYNDYGYNISSVAAAPDGSMYACVDVEFGPGIRILKFNSSGTLLWQKAWKDPEYYSKYKCNYIAVAPDGSVYACGAGQVDESTNTWKALIIKLNSSGEFQWKKIIHTDTFSSAESFVIAQDGSIYICGRTELLLYGSKYRRCTFVGKLDSYGDLQWIKLISEDNSSSNDKYAKIAVAFDGSVYITNTGGTPFIAKLTDDVIEQSSVSFDKFTVQDGNATIGDFEVSVHNNNPSVDNISLSTIISDSIVQDANLIYNKY